MLPTSSISANATQRTNHLAITIRENQMKDNLAETAAIDESHVFDLPVRECGRPHAPVFLHGSAALQRFIARVINENRLIAVGFRDRVQVLASVEGVNKTLQCLDILRPHVVAPP